MAEGRCRREVFKRTDGKWAWRVVGENGSDIVATDGSQGYTTKAFCITMMRKVTSGGYGDCPERIEAD